MKKKTVNAAARKAARARASDAIRKLEAKRAVAKGEAARAEIDHQIAVLKYARSHGRGF